MVIDTTCKIDFTTRRIGDILEFELLGRAERLKALETKVDEMWQPANDAFRTMRVELRMCEGLSPAAWWPLSL